MLSSLTSIVAISKGDAPSNKSTLSSWIWSSVGTFLSNSAYSSYNKITCSSNGQYVYAGGYPGSVGTYYSSNYGVTFSQNNTARPGNQCIGISCDPTGQYVVVCSFSGSYFRSSNYGVTFASISSGYTQTMMAVLCPTNYNKMLLVTNSGGNIQLTSNAFATTPTFTTTSYSSYYWRHCCADATFTNMYVFGYNSAGTIKSVIGVSNNGGSTWTINASNPLGLTYNANTPYMVCDATGQYVLIVDCALYGFHYSSNYGSTWTSVNLAISFSQCSCATDASTGNIQFIMTPFSSACQAYGLTYFVATNTWKYSQLSLSGQTAQSGCCISSDYTKAYLISNNSGSNNGIVYSTTPSS